MIRTHPSRPRRGDTGRFAASSLRRSFSHEVEARTRRLPGVVTTTIGSARYGEREYPLLACTTSDSGDHRRPWVLVSGGVHGDEVAGVFAALGFLETLAPTLARQLSNSPCYPASTRAVLNWKRSKPPTARTSTACSGPRRVNRRSSPWILPEAQTLEPQVRGLLPTFTRSLPTTAARGSSSRTTPGGVTSTGGGGGPLPADRPGDDRRFAAVVRGLSLAVHLRRYECRRCCLVPGSVQQPRLRRTDDFRRLPQRSVYQPLVYLGNPHGLAARGSRPGALDLAQCRPDSSRGRARRLRVGSEMTLPPLGRPPHGGNTSRSRIHARTGASRVFSGA